MEKQKMINPVTLKTLSRSFSLLGAVCILFFTSCKDEAPTCFISEPADEAVYLQGTNVTIEVDADDDDGTLFRKPGIEKVMFLIDDQLVSTVTAAPYSYSWSTAGEALGYHDIVTVAEDNGSNTTQDEISVLINDAPSCAITSPANNINAFQGSAVEIMVDADDDIGGPPAVEFYVNNSLIGTDNSSPFSYEWDTETSSPGNYTVKAVAVDEYNAETSDQITVEIAECLICGIWEGNYEGYDDNQGKNVTIRRRLRVEMNTEYTDTVSGKLEDESAFNIYEVEAGTWRISEDGTVVQWTATLAKRINFDTQTLEDYDPGDQQDEIKLNTAKDEWIFKDEVLSLDYTLQKQ
jgi:hypothetical protein